VLDGNPYSPPNGLVENEGKIDSPVVVFYERGLDLTPSQDFVYYAIAMLLTEAVEDGMVHVSGQSICQGVLDLAEDLNPGESAAFLASLMIGCSEDVGKIVDELKNLGLIQPSPDDDSADFMGLFDFRSEIERE